MKKVATNLPSSHSVAVDDAVPRPSVQPATQVPSKMEDDPLKARSKAFRLDVAKSIKEYLGKFRKPDCPYGRITNTEDFKHVCRKITHTIIEKEMKRTAGDI